MWFGEGAGKGENRNISSQFQGTGDCTTNTLNNVSFQSVWVNFEVTSQGNVWKRGCVFLSVNSSIVDSLS